MNSRERVLQSINHKEPDRVPVAVTLTPQIAKFLSKRFHIPCKLKSTGFSNYYNTISFNEILTKLGNDVIIIGATAPNNFILREFSDGSFIDEWGVRYKVVSYYKEIVEHPLKDIETVRQLNQYFDEHGFPDADSKGRFDFAEEEIEKYSKNYAIIGDLKTTMFEASWYLVGIEKFLIDLIMKKV